MSTDAPLQAASLTRAFDGEVALDGFDLVVSKGEIVALVGLNGAGKTTLMRLLLGMLNPSSGSASVLGFEASSAPSRMWASVGHLIETPFAYPELTVTENLTASALLHGLDRSEIPGVVATAIDDFHLGRWSKRRARALSLGNRQRLGLASALAHRPSVIVLDEPGNALDPEGVVFIRDLLRQRVEQGAAILVSSHHLDELARIADRIIVMHRGRHVGDLETRGVDLEKRFFDMVYAADIAQKSREA